MADEIYSVERQRSLYVCGGNIRQLAWYSLQTTCVSQSYVKMPTPQAVNLLNHSVPRTGWTYPSTHNHWSNRWDTSISIITRTANSFSILYLNLNLKPFNPFNLSVSDSLDTNGAIGYNAAPTYVKSFKKSILFCLQMFWQLAFQSLPQACLPQRPWT